MRVHRRTEGGDRPLPSKEKKVREKWCCALELVDVEAINDPHKLIGANKCGEQIKHRC